MMGRTVPWYILLLGVVLLGCSFDYSDAELAEERSQEIPQIELYGVRTQISRDTTLRLQAVHVATYPERDLQIMENVTFQEFGRDGDLRLEGEAELATLYLDTENVRLEGTIKFHSTIEDAEVESEFLYWDNDARTLSSEGSEVNFRRSDGSELNGNGMILDGRRNSVGFSSGVRGSYIVGEEE